MSLNYLIDPNMQFQDRNGVNNVAGFLRVYYEGTDDRATTYKDFIGTMNPADIPLDNNGRAVVIADSDKEYRVEVYSASGAMLWTQHPLFVQGGGGGGSEYDGDVSNATATFTKDDGDTSEMSSGSTLKVLFTKISKFFAGLKRVAFTGSYNDLSDRPSVPAAQVQSDWNQTNSQAVDFIKNKPNLAMVATSGSYNDLHDKPLFIALYGSTTYSDVEDAYFDNDQVVFCKYGTYLYQLKRFYNNKFIFGGTVDKGYGTFDTITLDSSNVWTTETHSVDEYCVYRKSYDALDPLRTATTATDISNGYMDVEFDLGNPDGFPVGDGKALVFIGIPNKGGPSGVDFADAFTKVELYAIDEDNAPFLAAKVKDTSKDDYGDTLSPIDLYTWNRTYSGNRASLIVVKKFRARFYLNMNMAWVPNLATKFYIYFTILL